MAKKPIYYNLFLKRASAFLHYLTQKYQFFFINNLFPRSKRYHKNEFCYLRVLGQASDDMKMDSVMSSRTCRRNSALAQASVADSILLGFSSQDWRDSIILEWFIEKNLQLIDARKIATNKCSFSWQVAVVKKWIRNAFLRTQIEVIIICLNNQYSV